MPVQGEGRPENQGALSVLKTGLDILFKQEGVQADKIYGHGGLFKTKGVGQGILAAALNTPVSVMETAGEGGAWGIALLASYMVNKKDGETLDDFLADEVFHGETGVEMQPDPKDVEGFLYQSQVEKASGIVAFELNCFLVMFQRLFIVRLVLITETKDEVGFEIIKSLCYQFLIQGYSLIVFELHE